MVIHDNLQPQANYSCIEGAVERRSTCAVMETWGDYIAKNYDYFFFENMDPNMKGRFLMDSPVPIMIIVTTYVLFVKWIGPWWMKDRPPYNVEKPMLLYNIVQMYINSTFVFLATNELWLSGEYSVICLTLKSNPDITDQRLVQYVHFFLMSRLLDLLDTVFMILKKNNHQVSFLHLYHHFMVALGSWMIIKYYGGGIGVFFGTINSLVHVFMYMYYFVTAYNPIYKKSIWWKKKITQIQLIQFFIIAVQQLLAIFSESCYYPKYVIMFFVSQVIIMIFLFSRFYKTAYENKKHSKQT